MARHQQRQPDDAGAQILAASLAFTVINNSQHVLFSELSFLNLIIRLSEFALICQGGNSIVGVRVLLTSLSRRLTDFSDRGKVDTGLLI